MSGEPVPALAVEGLGKSYGTTRALHDVSLSIRPGEVRALLGLNGAGKSTLIKILSGVFGPDDGSITLAGAPTVLRSPHEAMAAGIATVHQELSIVPGLSVAENVFLGRWPTTAGTRIDRRALIRASRALLQLLHAPFSPLAKAGDLPIGSQQLVEIARAVGSEPHVLMLDEPTSSLSVAEADDLIALVRKLADAGVAVVYISHRMDEIHRVADSISVLRDGRLVGTMPVQGSDARSIFSMMTGERQVTAAGVPVGSAARRPTALEVRGLTNQEISDVSFDLAEGEILGVAGVLGSGRTSLLRALAGAAPSSGRVAVRGRPVGRRTVARMRRCGVGLAPEDRKAQGLAMELSIASNVTMGCLPLVSTWGVSSARKEKQVLAAVMRRFGVAWRVSDPPSSLSGGNQQRVVLGRWIANGARILLLDEPTRGVDVHAKGQLYDLLAELSGLGISTIFTTSEFEELYRLTTRSLVLRHGRVLADVDLGEVTEEELMVLAMGEGKRADA